MDDILDLPESDRQNLRHTMLARQEYHQLIGRNQKTGDKDVYSDRRDWVRDAKDNMSVLSLSIWERLLKHARLWMWSMFHEKYRLFTFKPLYNLQFGILRILKETVIACLSSDSNLTILGLMQSKDRLLIQGPKALLRGFMPLLWRIKKEPEPLE